MLIPISFLSWHRTGHNGRVGALKTVYLCIIAFLFLIPIAQASYTAFIPYSGSYSNIPSGSGYYGWVITTKSDYVRVLRAWIPTGNAAESVSIYNCTGGAHYLGSANFSYCNNTGNSTDCADFSTQNITLLPGNQYSFMVPAFYIIPAVAYPNNPLDAGLYGDISLMETSSGGNGNNGCSTSVNNGGGINEIDVTTDLSYSLPSSNMLPYYIGLAVGQLDAGIVMLAAVLIAALIAVIAKGDVVISAVAFEVVLFVFAGGGMLGPDGIAIPLGAGLFMLILFILMGRKT